MFTHLTKLLDFQFLELKRFVVLFGKTMEGYALHVAPLFEFLMSIREQFEALLFNRLRYCKLFFIFLFFYLFYSYS
jgi:hypothetical protein